VALPVPLEATFTYEIGAVTPVVGGRVIVPFRTTKLSGIVVRLHDDRPEFKVKRVAQVLDSEPVLDEKLLALGQWISNYYLAPIGEVLRVMLPLQAEFRQQFGWRLTAQGADELLAGAPARAGRGARTSAEEHESAMAVLDHLADRDVVREESLRAATGATREVLRALAAKKWIAREDLSGSRDARRTVKFAQLADGAEHGKLNPQQQLVVDTLKDGRVELAELRAKVSASSLTTLTKRGVVEIVEEAAAQSVPAMKPRTTLEFMFTSAQKDALRTIQHSVNSRKFGVHLLHGVTGSGKTAVYLAAMQAVLKAGRGAILLVPEIGLTPGVAADLHGVFGEEIAILHSSLSDRERAEQWHRLRRGEAHIAVGTRSAVFAPVRDLALIIVDEEHDHSYKQEETPRYHARDVAAVRARDLGATVVLGSATPSLQPRRAARARAGASAA
jgi:primosomal protein N' (replication factor Y)